MKTIFHFPSSIFLLPFSLLLAVTLACAGCQPNPTPPVEEPSWQVEENLQAPILWSVADDAVEITSRMYLIANLGDTVSGQDKLAAWCAGECVSVVQPVSTPDGWLFYMIINRPRHADTEAIMLSFYSSQSGKVAYWPGLFRFTPDAVLGSADEPFCPSPDDRSAYPMYVMVHGSLPATIQPGQGDKMAVFVDNHCRMVLNPLEKNGQDGYDYSFHLPLNQPVETAEFRYFCREKGKIYVASGIEANTDDVTLLLNPIPFK